MLVIVSMLVVVIMIVITIVVESSQYFVVVHCYRICGSSSRTVTIFLDVTLDKNEKNTVDNDSSSEGGTRMSDVNIVVVVR